MGTAGKAACFRYSRSPGSLRENLLDQRSVGEPAEGSLSRAGLRAPGGFGPQLFTLCLRTIVALAGPEVFLALALGPVSARQRPITFHFSVSSEHTKN